MNSSDPAPWTLTVRWEGEALAVGLGDGRRLSLHARRPAPAPGRDGAPASAAAWLGDAIAERLAASPVRVLNIQVDPACDALAWETLRLGDSVLGRQFLVARQPAGDTDSVDVPARALTDALSVVVVHDGAPPDVPGAVAVSLEALDVTERRELARAAQVLVLDRVSLDRLDERMGLPLGERLVVLRWPVPDRQATMALDRGATLLGIRDRAEGRAERLESLLFHLRLGASVGYSLHLMQRRGSAADWNLQLYGNAELRFIRPQAPPSRRQVTSLSFDLVGSTTAMQRLGDEAYAEMLGHLHQRCTDVVRRHGGQPDDPQGNDGAMSYFGHPSALEDAASHAVAAGLEIAAAAGELGVSVRVGIATGDVVVRAGQPVGLSIHLAARLQQVTAAGTVLIAESTRQLIADTFVLEPLVDHPELKGIEATGRLHVVRGLSGDARTHRLERLSRLTPFVGRQVELERLEAGWAAARAGQRPLVWIEGEAGMGKSRLVREFRHRLEDARVRVLECRCSADASASPFLALTEALRQWIGLAPGETEAQALHKLARALNVADEPTQRGLLQALQGADPAGATADASASPARHRQRVLASLTTCFDGFAQAMPSCLIVEDWHWADPSMREFVDQLLQRDGGPGVLVAVTARAEAGVQAPSADAEKIDLAGLPLDAARELVSQASDNAALPAGLVRSIAARGDGVPLFLEEAARMALALGPDRLAAEAHALDAVPVTLQDLLMARLDAVGDAARSTAQRAAVLGREFSVEMLEALLQAGDARRSPGSLRESLAALDASGLVRSEGAGLYAFKHALVRDVAYASLWAKDRRALHARMVELLRSRWPDTARHRPELLAHHQTEAGLDLEALAQWELAARAATARSAELEAISHLRRALAILARGGAAIPQRDATALRLQLMLAGRLIATEGYGADAVAQAYQAAGRLCDALDDAGARFRVEMGLEGYRFMRADFERALEHGQRAAAIAQRSGDAKQRLHAHWGLACTLFHQGRLRATMAEMEAGLLLYTPSQHRAFGVQDPGVMCMAYSSWGLWERARPDAALQRIGRAIEVSTENEHKFSLAVAMAYCVSIHLLRGEPEAAIARADACIGVCDDAGFPVWLAITRCMRGRVLCERGEFEAGLAEMKAGHALWLSTGSQVSQPLYLALQAEGALLAGDTAAAIACVDRGLALAERYGERQYEAELRRLRGVGALQLGETAQAEAWFKGAHALALRQHRLGFALRSANALAALWAAQGRRERARRLLGPLLSRWTEGHGTRDVREATARHAALA